MIDFVLGKWEWFLLGFMIVEKIVKVTPCKWDDILVDGLISGVKDLVGKVTTK